VRWTSSSLDSTSVSPIDFVHPLQFHRLYLLDSLLHTWSYHTSSRSLELGWTSGLAGLVRLVAIIAANGLREEQASCLFGFGDNPFSCLPHCAGKHY
jgi:hypothetical protein